jgi:CTP synthase
MHDRESIYVVPEMMRDAGLDAAVVDILGLGDRVHPEAQTRAEATWDEFLQRLRSTKQGVSIGIAGKYTSVRDSYASVIKALEHGGVRCGVTVDIDWIDVSDVTQVNARDRLRLLDGIIVPAGFGVRGAEGKIACVEYARTHALPYLGICLGFQMAVIEIARHVCGIDGANSTEFEPDCKSPVISILPEQKQIEGLGGNMRLGGRDVVLTPGSLVARLFNHAPEIRLRFRHRYEVDPRYIESLEEGGLIFSGRATDYPIMQVLELPADVHPYFVATQAHPELTSRPLRPDPFFLGLVEAALRGKSREGAPQRSATSTK